MIVRKTSMIQRHRPNHYLEILYMAMKWLEKKDYYSFFLILNPSFFNLPNSTFDIQSSLDIENVLNPPRI